VAAPLKLEQDFPGVIATVDAPKYGIKERPYHVYLCTNFFQLSDTGYDSKGGTLIHEMTHFDVVNNTRDFCKGTTNCQEKAASAPDDAN
jgi:peptidyl-Lys metalloendopeptidase